MSERPRCLPLGADPAAAIRAALDVQRQCDRAVDDGPPIPFFQIVEDGETVDYAVVDLDGRSSLHRGGLPPGVARTAELIAVQNAGRARRPAATGAGRPAASPEPAESVLNPARIASEPAFANELWLPWRSPRYGTTWRLMFNPFPIWPPFAGSNGPFAEPLQMTVSREDLIHQREARGAGVIHDLLSLLAEINASPTLTDDCDRFRIGVNGWSYRHGGPKAGASQAQLHANLVRAHFPIESVTATAAPTGMSGVTRQTIDDAAIVLTGRDEGASLDALAAQAAATLTAIIDHGQSFNLLLAPGSAGGQRVFIFPRAVGIPQPLFTTEWAFAELSRSAVIDDPRQFYDLDRGQRAAADAAAIDGRLEPWLRVEKRAGRLTRIRPEMFADIRAARRLCTAPLPT